LSTIKSWLKWLQDEGPSRVEKKPHVNVRYTPAHPLDPNVGGPTLEPKGLAWGCSSGQHEAKLGLGAATSSGPHWQIKVLTNET
jgi:hypothetical protein